MKLPKVVRRYCPYCKKHTEHKLIIVKKRKSSPLKKGERYRREKIRHGYGGFPYSIQRKRGRYKVKLSKKIDLRFECTVCKKQHVWRQGLRARKVEIKA